MEGSDEKYAEAELKGTAQIQEASAQNPLARISKRHKQVFPRRGNTQPVIQGDLSQALGRRGGYSVSQLPQLRRGSRAPLESDGTYGSATGASAADTGAAAAAAPEDDWTHSVCLSAGAEALQLASSPPRCMSWRPLDMGTWGRAGEVEGHSFLTAEHGKRPQSTPMREQACPVHPHSGRADGRGRARPTATRAA